MSLRFLLSFLLSFFSGLNASAERAKIYTCSVYDGSSEDVAQLMHQFATQKHVSGILLTGSDPIEEYEKFSFSNATNQQILEQFKNREMADLIDAQQLTNKIRTCEPGHCELCGTFEGEVVFRQFITGDVVPPDKPSPIPLDQNTRYFVPAISAGILQGSAWNREIVVDHLDKVKSTLAKCGVEIDNVEIKDIPNPGGKYDSITNTLAVRVSEHVVSDFEKEMAEMISGLDFTRPGFLFLKKLIEKGNERDFGNCVGFAAMKWKVVPRNSPVADLIFLSDDFAPAKNDCDIRVVSHDYTIEEHEIGHILLDDGGHELSTANPMNNFESSDTFTDAQCAQIRANHYVQKELKH